MRAQFENGWFAVIFDGKDGYLYNEKGDEVEAFLLQFMPDVSPSELKLLIEKRYKEIVFGD